MKGEPRFLAETGVLVPLPHDDAPTYLNESARFSCDFAWLQMKEASGNCRAGILIP